MKASYSDLKDKKIIVTGSTGGIGQEIVANLLAQGAHVVAHARQESERTQKIQEIAKDLSGKLEFSFFDMTDAQKMNDEIARITEQGYVSGLVNNAGISKDQLIMRVKPDDIDFILNTNLKSAIMLTSALSKNFLRAQNVSIVNVSSVVGMMGNTSQAVYAASKAGLIGFTKSMAKELASRNIRSNAIAPGFIETPMTDALADKAKEHYLGAVPLARFGEATEVAELTSFLLSQASSYITGEVIKIDGGLYI